jgi:hypothetical protein
MDVLVVGMIMCERPAEECQWLNDDENFVNVRTYEVIELVEDMINDLRKQAVLLILESMFHEQGEDLVKEKTSMRVSRSMMMRIL